MRPATAVSRHAAPRRYWVPAAAVGLVVAGALVWGLWLWKAAGPVIVLEARSADIAPDLQMVSAMLFSAIETSSTTMAAMGDLSELQAALEGGASCQWAPAFTPGCEEVQDDLVEPAGSEA